LLIIAGKFIDKSFFSKKITKLSLLLQLSLNKRAKVFYYLALMVKYNTFARWEKKSITLQYTVLRANLACRYDKD